VIKSSCRFIVCSLIVVLISLFAASRHACLAQSSLVHSDKTALPHPTNLDFEQGLVGQVPDDWNSPTKPNYTAEVTEGQAKSGQHSALLRSEPNAVAGGPPFGNLMQTFDATPFRGRRVRFRAAVRMEPSEAGGRAQLWLRVDRTANNPGFFDNMGNRPITSGNWQYYEIVGDVDEDAVVINIGMILLGKGKAWLDDASFEDLGKLVVRAEPPRPLTPRGLENVVAFTRLLGYVRHFHPSDEAATADWDSFAIENVSIAERASNARDLARKLEDIFRSLAPTIRVFPTGHPPRLARELRPPQDVASLQVVSWRHKGFGQAGKKATYTSERVRKDAPGGRVPPNSPDPLKPFSANLGGGVSCFVPLALFADAQGTLPHSAAPAGEKKETLLKYSGNDRATRLADVALAWNILQHFYPYFDVVQTDWPQALRVALESAATDADEQAFLVTLRRMIAKLHDGHGAVYNPNSRTFYSAPVLFGWVEGQLVILNVAATGAEGLQPGDIVLEVDGKPGIGMLTESETLISAATPQWKRFVALNRMRMGDKDSELRLDVRTPAGETRSVVLRRTMEAEALQEMRPNKIAELRPGIFYLDLDRIKDEDFQAILPKLEQATGIIFDLRGYPAVSPVIISHLIDSPVESARWNIPIVTTPDHAHIVEYDTGGRWKLDPIAPRLKAKTVFLTDGRAISYAESYMGIIEAYRLAEIVGEPTAGTNGDVNPFALPGNYTVVWTGMKVLKHDGSQHHGIGIRPTVPVSPTIQGLRERRDEQLERAIAIVSK
jgi:C-terminal processing protease CtpA/Prc